MKLSYYRPGSPSGKSPFQKAPSKRRRRWLSAISRLFGLITLVTVLVYALLLRPEPQVSADSTAYHQTSVYSQAVANSFKQLKNRTKLTLDQRAIADDLQKQFPEIAQVEFDVPLFSQIPRVMLNIASPGFMLKAQNREFVISKEGVVVEQAGGGAQTNDLPVVVDQSGVDIRGGDQIMSREEVVFITTLVAQVKGSKVPIAEIVLPSVPQELLIKTSDQPYLVRFYLGGEPLQQIGQFLAARNEFQKNGTHPKQYLDVRIAGKIYYK